MNGLRGRKEFIFGDAFIRGSNVLKLGSVEAIRKRRIGTYVLPTDLGRNIATDGYTLLRSIASTLLASLLLCLLFVKTRL